MVKYELFPSCLRIRELQAVQAFSVQALSEPAFPWASPTSTPAFNHLLHHHFNQRGIVLMWFPAGAFLSIDLRDKEQNRAERDHWVGK